MTRTEEAPAKINLTLEVLGDLPGGYHELDTVFCTLELADRLTWTQAPETTLTLTGEMSGLPITTGDDNLVLRALRALEDACGRPMPMHIELFKQIPAGGGLGGGSADAAALMYSVNRAFHLGLSVERLEELARPLGADVAFGIRGGVARGTGRGDRLEPLPPLPQQSLILVFPPFGCPTGEVYRAWHVDRPTPAAGRSQKLVSALRRGALGFWADYLGNDLEPAAQRVQPDLVEIATCLLARDWGPVLLCGSGSTLSCWGAPSAEAVEEALAPWNCRALATRLHGLPRP